MSKQMTMEDWLERKEAAKAAKEAAKARGYRTDPAVAIAREREKAKERLEAAKRHGVTRKPRQAPVSPVSASRRIQLKAYAKLKRAWLKGRLCQRCNAPASDLHHSRGRVGRLLVAVQFWKALCWPCHNWVGSHPAEAREAGLLCAEGEWNKQP